MVYPQSFIRTTKTMYSTRVTTPRLAQSLRHLRRNLHSVRPRCSEQTPRTPPSVKPDSTTPPPRASRIARIEARLPKFLRHIITPLRNAPLSHITAFLLLHEVTAIVPLFALAATFHYTQWLPPFISEGKWMKEGVERFGKWMRKKGWLNADGQEEAKERWWGRGEGGVGLLVEVATAYAVTKALLPVRLVLSVWATPWFARWTVLPVTNGFTRRFRRIKA